ncbi:MAG: ribbon-helix-helix protein, CopG family [bacterium]|nr:ribbon-helix-helix protein, CopG family [Myxococcales bacterium]
MAASAALLPPDEARRLERLARRTGRSVESHLREAIERYVDFETRQLERIERGLADADAGRTVDHARVADWLSRWGDDDEGPAPQ